jgi:hypothetical protein
MHTAVITSYTAAPSHRCRIVLRGRNDVFMDVL